MPAIEAGICVTFVLRDHLAVGITVMRMPQVDVVEAHERIDEAVSLNLDLGLVGDTHEKFVHVMTAGFVMAIRFGGRIKTFGQLILSFGGKIL